MCLNKPNSKNINAFKNIKLGVIKDDLEMPLSIQKVYEKDKTLPMNFQILYAKGFDNPGLTGTMLKNMNIDQYGSLHSISNISSIASLNLIPEKLLYHIKQNSVYSRTKMGTGTFRASYHRDEKRKLWLGSRISEYSQII